MSKNGQPYSGMFKLCPLLSALCSLPLALCPCMLLLLLLLIKKLA